MNCIEYGSEHSDCIVLLHGGGLSWWNYRTAAEALSADYRVILPVLDGHADSTHPFTGIAENAARIIQWIDAAAGGSVLLLGGLSLGGQIAVEILSQRPDICRCAMIESASVIPSPLTAAMIRPAFGTCYGLIRRRWFAKLQFRSLRIDGSLFADYYRDTCAIQKQDMIAFLEDSARYAPGPFAEDMTVPVQILYGSRETAVIKRSAEALHKRLKNSTVSVLLGMYHGEFSINHGADYAAAVRGLISSAVR